MFGIESLPVVALVLVGGGVVFLLVQTLLFRAGCALADVAEPSFPRSLLVVGAAVLVCLPLGVLLVHLLGAYDGEAAGLLGPMSALGLLLALLLSWVLSALLFTLVLSAPYKKGLLVAAFELLLSGLLSALVAAVVLVVLALVQIVVRQEPQPKALHTPAPGAYRAAGLPALLP
jgi:hypothetical protein